MCLVLWNGEKDTGTQSVLPSKAATTPTSETFIEHNVVREGQKLSLLQVDSPQTLEAMEERGCSLGLLEQQALTTIPVSEDRKDL